MSKLSTTLSGFRAVRAVHGLRAAILSLATSHEESETILCSSLSFVFCKMGCYSCTNPWKRVTSSLELAHTENWEIVGISFLQSF